MVATVAILSFLAARTLGQPAPKLTSTDDKPPLRQEELEQLLAPIALYPDALLTQMLMASTYPLEVVQAERWVKAHKGLTGDALAKELEPLNWDPSVKSMVNFPEQLTAMSDKLDLTLKIGNAFLEQQADVLNTIQVLRNRAQEKGNLKSNEQQKVTVQAVTPAANVQATTQVVTVVQPPPQIITVESTSPDIVYIPSYNPVNVYGGWPYPAYPPYYYYPPGYYYGSNLVSFGVGVAFGAAWGYAWGHCNWGSGDIDIDVDRNINRNTNINRDQARQNMQNRQTNRQDNRGNRQGQGNRQSWQHDPSHRRGAAYRDTRTADRFGGAGSSRQAAQAREQFRGRSEHAFGNSPRGTGAGQMRSMDSGSRAGSGAGAGAGAGNVGQNRGSVGGSAGGTGGAGRAAGVGRVGTSSGGGGGGGYSGTRGGTFSGVDRGGGGARQEAARGRSSGGYGGSRGGGGGGGGGRGGGGRR